MRVRGSAVVRFAVVAGAVLVGVPPAARAAAPSKAECLTASEAWIKLRKDGKLRAAREQLLVCAASACPSEVRQECSRRASEVSAVIPTLVLVAKSPDGTDLSAVQVSMDGQPLLDRLDGRAVAIDPGEHVFRLQAAGSLPVEKIFVLREGDHDRHETVVVGSAATVPAPTPSPPSAAPAAATSEPPIEGGSRWSTPKTLALVAGGVALGGIAVGTVFGLQASSKWSQAKTDCRGGCDATVNPQALVERTDALSAATVSTIAFGVGGAAVAGALLLW